MSENDPKSEEMKKSQEPKEVTATPEYDTKITIDPKQERMWAMFCHLSAFVGLVGIPFGTILGPLVLWLVKKNEMPLVDQEGKEALNFQISMAIYAIVATVLVFILIGVILLWGLIIADVVLIIVAAIKTNIGEKFSYPCTIRFIK